MCGDDPIGGHRVGRRDLLAGALVLGAGVLGRTGGAAAAAETRLPAVAPIEVADGLVIVPRDGWGADLPPTGPLTTDDIRFLLVHHTASSNRPPSGGTPAVLRSTYAFQTGPAKRWPDVCYGFFVDRDGVVWEGRAGSLSGPVRADATGGSQGFAQLVCLIGDFTADVPTAAAQDSLVRVLAWLADRSGIDTSPGATATFTSRGSQRWAAGSSVTTATIAPHRAMSYTACPGAAFAPYVEQELMARVDAHRRATPPPARPPGPVPAVRGRPAFPGPRS